MKIELTQEQIALIEQYLNKPGFPRLELSVKNGQIQVIAVNRKLIG